MLQYLHGYVLLRTALQAGGCAANVAGDLGRFMGETHRQTHAALLPEAQRAALEARFRNADMCAITAEYVFSKPLDEADPTNRCSAALAPHAAAVRRQAGVREEVLALRQLFETSRRAVPRVPCPVPRAPCPVGVGVGVGMGMGMGTWRLATGFSTPCTATCTQAPA